MSHLHVAFIVLFFVAAAQALQLLLATQIVGHGRSAYGLGVDFTVNAAVDVSAVGIVDCDQPGFVNTISARIFDRSTGQVVVGPVMFSSNDDRANDTNPFAFRPIQTVRLAPGLYCLVSDGFASDRYLSTGAAARSVVAGDSGGAVLVTAAVVGGNGSAPITTLSTNYEHHPTELLVGATFVFSVVPTAVPPSLEPEFADCEVVACAGLTSGLFNIRGQSRYCDNEVDGGGWMRLWFVNESSCELNDWSSARNPFVSGFDRLGCRPVNSSCQGKRIASPLPFNEVRGANWRVWSYGSPGAFNSRLPCEGVVVRGAVGTVWAFAAGFEQYPQGRCPCEPGFINSTDSKLQLGAAGTHWTCDRAPRDAIHGWFPLFQADSPALCAGTSGSNPDEFRRRLPTPHQWLSVAICKNEVDKDEDLKLSSGELFVRSTAGFDKKTTCTTASTTVFLGATMKTVAQTSNRSSSAGATPSTPLNSTMMVMTSAGVPRSAGPSAALVGGAIGGCVALVLVAAIVTFLACKRRTRRADSSVSLAAVVPESDYGRLPLGRTRTPADDGDASGVRPPAVANVYEVANSAFNF